ncbi:hypothetical protein D3C71_1651970 [compost metagenome]
MAQQAAPIRGFHGDPPATFDTLQKWKDWHASVSQWPARDPDRQVYLKQARQIIREKSAEPSPSPSPDVSSE